MEHKLRPDEYICPVLFKHYGKDKLHKCIVDNEYCDSSTMDEGCVFKKDCGE